MVNLGSLTGRLLLAHFKLKIDNVLLSTKIAHNGA